VLTIRPGELPFVAKRIIRIAQAVVPGELGGGFRRAAPREIGGGCTKQMPISGKAPRDQARIGHGGHADGKIEAFVDHIDHPSVIIT
jgi:hypothetical protein